MPLRLLAAVLLATTAIGGVAHAQSAAPTEQTRPAKKKTTATAPAATPAVATPAKAAPKRDPRALGGGQTASPTDFGTVFAGGGSGETTPGGVNRQDLGGGMMIEEEVPKSRSTVTRDAIDKMPPTTNPFLMIESLPAAVVTSTDATGLNGGDITLRGFTSEQIGMTIEGAPVNDSGNYALYPQEYVDAENTWQVSTAQGSPDLDSPHIGSTGGVINVYMRDPAKTAGGYFSTTVGMHNHWRQFLRLESGQVGNVRGYVSYSYNYRNHWSGLGADNRSHIDAKMVWDLDAGNHVRASVIYNEALNHFYSNPTAANFATDGWLPNYNEFLTGNASTDTNWYGYKINPFKNAIVSLPSDFRITDDLTYDVVPYLWYGFGSGGGVSTLVEDDGTGASRFYYGNSRVTGVDWNGDGAVVNGTRVNYYSPSVTKTWRPGIVNKLTWTTGDHKIVGGYWFEAAQHRQTGPYQSLESGGTIRDAFLGDGGGFVLPDGRTMMKRDTLTRTTTHMFFLGDTWSLMGDTLKLDFGVKQAFVSRDLTNSLPGAANPQLTTHDAATLPQAGINWRFAPQQQLFASVGTSFRTTPNYSLMDSFSTSTGAITTYATPDQKPERSVSLELGHRYQGDLFATSVSVFGTRYSDRQVSTKVLDDFGNSTTSYVNAGSVTSWGVEGEIGTRPLLGGFRPYVSAAYLKTRMEDDLPTTTTVGGVTRVDAFATTGKELPKSPNFMGTIGLDYDDGNILGNLSVKYVGPQYSTFVNDEKIAGYARLNAAIGYRFGDVEIGDKAKLKRPELKLSLYNLLDSRQLTGVQSVQTNAQPTTTVSGVAVGASGTPRYYLGEGFAAMLTFKTAF